MIENNEKEQLLNNPINFNGSYVYNENKIIAVGNNGIILLSNDAGTTWKQTETNIKENLNSIYGWWIVGDNGTLLTTFDNGLTWQQVESNTRYNLNRIYENVAVGDNGTTLRTFSSTTRVSRIISP